MIKFQDFKESLKELLNFFERQECYITGVHFISGGFARADYDYFDEEDEENACVYFTLKWGVQNDVEDRVHTEHYKIFIKDLLSKYSLKDKYSLIQDA